MTKKAITILCSLVFAAGAGITVTALHAADPIEEAAQMQQHMLAMQIKEPARYQEMVTRAGGNIVNCCSCHVEACAKR